jgi:hypothetical protein
MNNQNSLEHYLAKQSLFKTSNKVSHVYLSHQKYVEPQGNNARAQFIPKTENWKVESRLHNTSYQGKRTERKIEGLTLNEIEGLERSLNQREQVSKSMHAGTEEGRGEIYRPYFVSRAEPKPFSLSGSKKTESKPISKPSESANKAE